MARTIYGEIRGYSYMDQLAVAWVIRNRADRPSWWGRTIEEVCLKPKQFSCWNEGDPNLDVLKAAHMDQPAFRSCYRAALAAYDRKEVDPTNKATHYHTVARPTWAQDWPPKWVYGMVPTMTIGPHKFYLEV